MKTLFGALFVALAILMFSSAVYAEVCATQVAQVSANCTGQITSDQISGDGCRVLTCQSANGNVTVKACNKPGDYQPQYFEMYRQAASGAIPKLCLAQSCIQNNGYAKSNSFPICTAPTNTTPNQTTCYAKVNDFEISCTGGTITQDNKGSCRTVTCSGATGSLQVLACDKPNSNNAQYFEMYKQTANGTNPTICIGQTCLRNEGYVKSTTLPFCTNTTQPTNSTNQTNTTPNICTNDVTQAAVTCTEGTKTQDTGGNCRTVTCTAADRTTTVLACNKPDGKPAQYFEIYKQQQTGTPLKICFGNTCINNEGYVKSNACTPPTVNVSLANLYPVDHNTVFACNATGFVPTSYTWNFGDGDTSQLKTTSYYKIFHSFAANGTYNVTCSATNGVTTANGSTSVAISTPIPPMIENEHYYAVMLNLVNQTNQTYTFECTSVGFRADNYIWKIDDQEKSIHSGTITIDLEAGQHQVYCGAELKNNTAYRVNATSVDNYCIYDDINAQKCSAVGFTGYPLGSALTVLTVQ